MSTIAIYPDLPDSPPTSAGAAREIDVIRRLAAGLPPDHAIIHGVLWSSISGGRQCFGEIDAVVLAPSGHLLLLEVKAGPLEFTATEIKKHYSDKTKNVLGQINMQLAAFRQRMKEEKLQTQLAQMLVVPDVRLASASIAYPRERIIDASNYHELAQRAFSAMPLGDPDPARFERAKRFLLNLFSLSLDPTARIDFLKTTVSRISDGLATWVPRISSANGQFCIEATAGSGKTQLAIRLLSDALRDGFKACYCCFNQPLAGHMRRVLPEFATAINTFHELAIAHWRRQGGEPDFSQAETFASAATAFCAAAQTALPALDLLIIDEAQDFSPQWIEALQRQLCPGGRFYLMQDDDQRLYARGDSSDYIQAAVSVRCRDNFRSPRRIVETINAFGLSSQPIIARCPETGEIPDFHVWGSDDPGGLNLLAERLESLIAAGETPKNIAILSFLGRRKSRLLQDTGAIAGYPLRRFTGHYDAAGNPHWSNGLIQAETLFRFKGQAAPIILLCEADFAELDTNTRRRLFVAMTRAQWRFECFLSERAAEALGSAMR